MKNKNQVRQKASAEAAAQQGESKGVNSGDPSNGAPKPPLRLLCYGPDDDDLYQSSDGRLFFVKQLGGEEREICRAEARTWLLETFIPPELHPDFSIGQAQPGRKPNPAMKGALGWYRLDPGLAAHMPEDDGPPFRRGLATVYTRWASQLRISAAILERSAATPLPRLGRLAPKKREMN